ncbi:hypothetical protein MPSEU_000039700 [Mayamaea pseudoterrestris]|nr:hypothetical protein MPSEU_000039700 [Mayamaea pseudoterrestris]
MGFGNADKTLTLKRRSKTSNLEPVASALAASAPPPKNQSKLHDLRYSKATPVDSPRRANKAALPRRRIIQAHPAKCELMKQISGLDMDDVAAGATSIKRDEDEDQHAACSEYDDDDDEISISDLFSVSSDPNTTVTENTTKEGTNRRFHKSLQDDKLLSKTMLLLQRSPRKSKRKAPARRKGSSNATIMTSTMNTSGSSLDIEQVIANAACNDGSRSLLDNSTASPVFANSRRTFHDSVSSVDSNAIVLQAALSEMHRSHDSVLVQEALKSVGDLPFCASDVTLEAPILDRASSQTRPMPSMKDVFQKAAKQEALPMAASVPLEVTLCGQDLTFQAAPLNEAAMEPTPAAATEAEANSSSCNTIKTPKQGNKTRILIRNRNLTDRLHASLDNIDFDFISAPTITPTTAASIDASPTMHSPQKKKLQIGVRHVSRFPSGLVAALAAESGCDGSANAAMDQHAAMLAFTRRAPKVSRSIGAPSRAALTATSAAATETSRAMAKRRPTIA